jgi:Holliday junction resolvase RusA-like endonuclease
VINLLIPKRRIVVYGIPQPQGSKSARVLPHEVRAKGDQCVGGRAILTEGFGEGPRDRKSWRDAVAEAGRAWLTAHDAPAPLDGPLVMWAWFYLPRPPSAPKSVTLPFRKPDNSKLLRSVEDALSGILYVDDARFVDSHISKRFAINTPPHAVIEIEIALDH